MTPRIEVEVRGRRRRVVLSAILDTGFDGSVCLPLEIAVKLGLELWAYGIVELADGSKKQELVFKGAAKIAGKTQDVEIFVTNSEHALVGTALLTGHRVTLDFPQGTVNVKRRSPRTK